MNRNRIILCLLLPAACMLQSHADDFGIWTDAGLSQKIGTTGLTASGGIEFRSGNKLKSVDRWDASIGLDYDLTPNLKAGIGYNYIYSYSPSECENKYKESTGLYSGYNVSNNFWRSKNRFTFDLEGSFDINRFTVSIRERYQLTRFNPATYRKDKYRYNHYQTSTGADSLVLKSAESEMDRKDSKTEHYLRSRIEVEYNINHCPITPFISFELSNNLSNGFSIDKRRYSVGFDYKISKGQHISLGYLYNNGSDDDTFADSHVIQISYKLKGLFGK